MDHLLTIGEIENIGYIHLDVEGFESNVIKGANEIISKYNPIITFEQHLTKDDYIKLCKHLFDKGYNIYLINEKLVGNNFDSRNFLAVPKISKINIQDINDKIGRPVLISVMKHSNVLIKPELTATIYGEWIGKIHKNVNGIKIHDNLYVFTICEQNYTKMCLIDSKYNWIQGLNILGIINLDCKESIINAYYSSEKIIIKREYYNITDITEIV